MALLCLLALLTAIPAIEGQHLTSFKFPGYGFSWYDPNCGFSCYNAISSAVLSCVPADHTDAHSHGGATTPDCQAQDKAFLTTIAHCINTRCDPSETPVWKRERYWTTKMLSAGAVQPKWTYPQALQELGDQKPTLVYNSSSKDAMNTTMVISDVDYNKQFKFNQNFDHLEMLQARFSIVLVTLGFGVPILCTILFKLPFLHTLLDKIKPYLIYPSSIGTYQVRPLPWLIGNAPTIGQAIYIFLFFLLNVILSAVDYRSSQPHPWFFMPREEMLSYIGYRTGHIAYALLPLLILFSSRNNFLLWITNWSYGTYLLLHRWVARIFALHAIIHSITLLLEYQGNGTYAAESVKSYWSWGIVATVLTCAMLVFSVLYFRRFAYELFLIIHIVSAILVIVGCWYHVILKWNFNFYDNWLFAASAVWFFDRAVRVLRVLKNGLRYARVRDIGEHYVRVDIPGVRWTSKPGYTGFVGFPTLNMMRPWENHPFSINATTSFRSYKHTLVPISSNSSMAPGECEADLHSKSKEANDMTVRETPSIGTTAGVTFIIKKNTGLTNSLKTHSRLLTLLDGPYRYSSSSEALKTDHLLLIGGGIGITGLLAWFTAHPNTTLRWSVKSSAKPLVDEMSLALENVADKQIALGHRFNVKKLLQKEAHAGYKRVGVVVCGPAGMCDEVRAVVAGLGRGSKTMFELHVDVFSW